MYKTAQVISRTPVTEDGKSTVVVRLSGADKGEADVDVPLTVDRSWTQEDFIDRVRQIATARNPVESFLDKLSVPSQTINIDRGPQVASPAQVYQARAAELRRIKQLQADGVTDTGLTTRANQLLAQLNPNGTYAAAFS